MFSTRFVEANLTLKAPEDWDVEANGPCEDLHVYAKDGTITSVWKPTPEELAELNAGGGVALTIYGRSMPPVALWTIKMEAATEAEIAEKVEIPIADDQEDEVSEVEDPHPEVVDTGSRVRALTEDEEHDTIEDVARKNEASKN